MLPSKTQWASWTLPSKYSLVSVLMGLISIVLAVLLFLYQEYGKSSAVNQVKDLVSQSVLHIVPNDLKFYLDEIKDNGHPNRFTVSLTVQARTPPILLVRKAEVTSFNLNQNHFSNEYLEFREFNVINVTSDKISLESAAEVAEIKLVVNTRFVFVKPTDLVWNAESLRDQEVGNVEVKLYYQYQGREQSKLIKVPIRFV
jgi:hypothetical protein|tara:strand:+ start:3248 stop:3847 length:600 start_codon:yes stop_codon:yes gene_type:complete